MEMEGKPVVNCMLSRCFQRYGGTLSLPGLEGGGVDRSCAGPARRDAGFRQILRIFLFAPLLFENRTADYRRKIGRSRKLN
jgi:hypothetical protein